MGWHIVCAQEIVAIAVTIPRSKIQLFRLKFMTAVTDSERDPTIVNLMGRCSLPRSLGE